VGAIDPIDRAQWYCTSPLDAAPIGGSEEVPQPCGVVLVALSVDASMDRIGPIQYCASSRDDGSGADEPNLDFLVNDSVRMDAVKRPTMLGWPIDAMSACQNCDSMERGTPGAGPPIWT
jgi:hypothetical protein